MFMVKRVFETFARTQLGPNFDWLDWAFAESQLGPNCMLENSNSNSTQIVNSLQGQFGLSQVALIKYPKA